MTVAMLCVLVGLGTWQVRRLAWKEGILRQIDQSERAPPMPLSAAPEPFAKVRVAGRFRPDLAAFYGAEVRDTPGGPRLGSQLIMPLERPGAPPLLVDRGWVPNARSEPIETPAGVAEVTGFIRPAEKPGPFSARDDPITREFYTLNPGAIGTALGLAEVAPFTLVALGTPSPTPASYPIPAEALPRPPNNHLSYAITWYGLAVTLVVIFAVWARKALRS